MAGYLAELNQRMINLAEATEPSEEGTYLAVIASELERTSPDQFNPNVRADFVLVRHRFAGAARNLGGLMTARVREQIAKLGRAAAPVFDGHVGLSQPIVRTFAWLSDSDLKAIIERDYAEVQVALFPSRAWKSCVVMCGSILESVLYDVLRNSQPRIDAASKSAKAPTGKSLTGGKWELWNLIEVAADIGVLPREREESIDVVLRDYRNFVHPLKEKRLQHPCGEGEAMMAFGGLIGVCDHLEKTAAANGGLP